MSDFLMSDFHVSRFFTPFSPARAGWRRAGDEVIPFLSSLSRTNRDFVLLTLFATTQPGLQWLLLLIES